MAELGRQETWRRQLGSRLAGGGGLALCTLVAVLDWALGRSVILLGFLVVGMFCAALGATTRWTVLVAAYAVGLAVVLGVPGGIFGTRDHAVRVGVIISAGLLAIRLAQLRTRAEMELNRRTRAEERIRDVLEFAPDAMVVVDGDDRLRWVSRRAEDLFGHRREDLLGERAGLLIAPAGELPAGLRLDRTRLVDWVDLSDVLMARRGDGGLRPVQVTLSTVRFDNDLVIAAVRDISGQRRVQEALAASERRFRGAVDSMLDPFAIYSPVRADGGVADLRLEYLNRAAQRPGTLGGDQQIGDLMTETYPRVRDGLLDAYRQVIETGEPFAVESLTFTTEVTGVETLAAALDVRATRLGDGLAVAWRDVTDRKREELALRASEARFRSVFDDSPIGMALLDTREDTRTRLLDANRTLCYLLGRSEAELTSTTLSALVLPEDRAAIEAALEQLLSGQSRVVTLEARLPAGGGLIAWALIAACRVPSGDGGPDLVLLHVQDITARKNAERQLADRAVRDPLTGLANRTLLLDRLTHALAHAHRHGRTVAVMFLDLDKFKVVNDSLGHDAGDRLLVMIATRLEDELRESDTAARLGGDEFIVVCEDIDEDEAAKIAERIRAALAVPHRLDGADWPVTASIGIALARPGAQLTPDELIRDADLAMYRAKQLGADRWELFDPVLRSRALHRLHTAIELRRAMDDNEMRLFYQPIVTLADGRIAGFEALLRWAHPQRGILAPGGFLDVAEDSGLIVPIGRWALAAACRQTAAWGRLPEADGNCPVIAVNVSLHQLVRGDLSAAVTDALAASGLPPSGLHLEITESVLLEGGRSTSAELTNLDARGIRLGLDDFGTGYSSLTYLKRFPVRFIKIDRSFVDGLGKDAGDTAIVEAIVGLSRALDLDVVAEGVETPDQAATLRQLGCRYAQGYHFGAPQPAEIAEEMLRGERRASGGSAALRLS